MNTTAVRIEGGILSPDFLERIHEVAGQRPPDFGLPPRRRLLDEVTSVWADAQSYWEAFQRRLARARGADSITSITREQWMLPLLEAFGYQLVFQRRAAQADGRAYAISHRAGEDEAAPPVHITGCDQELGSRAPSGRGSLSPHGLVQDYLNRTDHLWGVVTNGNVLRLLRNSCYFTRPSFIEFNLKQMFEGSLLDEFILMYRLAHRSRLPRGIEDASACLLEHYHQSAIEQGGRIRDGLRDAVEKAIVTLGNGFLEHPKNEALRERIKTGGLSPREFYRQLLYLIYRLLFLMVAEERNLLRDPGVDPQTLTFDSARLYQQGLSIGRLRLLADEPLTAPERFDDLYLGLRTLFYILRDEDSASRLALPTLNGQLFDEVEIDTAWLSNRHLLDAVSMLSYFVPAGERVRRRVNYAALDVEELGSVYESLLEFQPVVGEQNGVLGFEARRVVLHPRPERSLR